MAPSHATAPVVRLTVFAKPRAKQSRIAKADGLTAFVSLAAPPVDGAANAELLALFANVLGVPRRMLRLVLGASGKNKVVEVHGLEADDVVRRLAAAAER